MHDQRFHMCSPGKGHLALSGVLPRTFEDGSLRRDVLLALSVVDRQLIVDFTDVVLVPHWSRRELRFLWIVADHFSRAIQYVSAPTTVATLVLPALGVPVVLDEPCRHRRAQASPSRTLTARGAAMPRTGLGADSAPLHN